MSHTPKAISDLSSRHYATNPGIPLLLALLVIVALWGGAFAGGFFSLGSALASGGVVLFVCLFLGLGFFMLEPAEVGVVSLFDDYVGVASDTGLLWVWPWLAVRKVSLRLRNFDTGTIKVNDKSGNPIEIGAAVVWKVSDAPKSVYKVDNYNKFIRVQADVALRSVAATTFYDRWESAEEGDENESAKIARGPKKTERTLLEDREESGREIAEILKHAVGDVGLDIESVRITHLAYAPEIAVAMLKRQSAQAFVDARSVLVKGIVSAVKDAVEKFPEVKGDQDRMAGFITNMMVTLSSEGGTQPVINVGDKRA